MAIKRRTKIKAEFSMSSLTDIIFLLLIFFMLTSSFVTPNALRLMLPQADSPSEARRTVNVSITPTLEYFVNQTQVAETRLQQALQNELAGQAEPVILLFADKTVPIENVVNVMVVAKNLNARVILATDPQ